MIDLSSHHARRARCARHRPECIRVAGGEKSSVQCADPTARATRACHMPRCFWGRRRAVAFQPRTPVPRPLFASSSRYGGSAIPINAARRVPSASAGGGKAVAQVGVAEPRALAYDASVTCLRRGHG